MKNVKIITTKWSSNKPEDEFYVYDPATGKPQVKILGADTNGVNRAIDFLHKTFISSWRHVHSSQRGELLIKCAELLEKHVNELAELEAIENGKPLGQAIGDVQECINTFKVYGGICLSGDFPSHIYDSGSIINISTLEPFGVVGGIIPFNWPPIHIAAKVAPALAVGNTVAIKPPEQDPTSVVRICELINTILPEGVVEVILGLGATGAAISSNNIVKMISFTGSVLTGKAVARSAASNLTPTIMELGGKNALIAFEDADIEKVIRDIIDGAFYNQGEACTGASRILLHESIYGKILPKVIEAIPKLKVGHPLDTKTHVGPIVSKAQQGKILAYLELAKEEGATIAAQAPIPIEEEYKDGFWVPPTLVTDVTPDMRIMKEEIFGPITCVTSFKTYDEAIEIANGTDFGLVAGIYSESFQQCWKASGDIDAGSFFINSYDRHSILKTPFGGCKDSGYGRERYIDTMSEFGMLKTRKFPTGKTPVPQWFAVDDVLG